VWVVWLPDGAGAVDGASRGGRGRKLHEEEGRLETRVNISDMRRCWTDVSCSFGD
jgi:hypothetical protein